MFDKLKLAASQSVDLFCLHWQHSNVNLAYGGGNALLQIIEFENESISNHSKTVAKHQILEGHQCDSIIN